ncbi:hypothetical protein PPM_2777 [Paenibacillus polymyxa M1]|uniref:hypothetical protein n=1 Tax=Paenibacillus polymyxa TaxID=1406 RepID=UPI00021BBDF2|nr:hypothetical protein [Paenibacillus polymyxa]CCC85714.1 hypothetical protein PPM_2777 [Paenibacillus polymyxa M1]
MSSNPAIEFIKNAHVLEHYFKKNLSISRVMIRTESLIFLLASVISVLVTAICSYFTDSKISFMFVLLFGGLTIFLVNRSVRSSHKFVFEKYPRFRAIINNRIFVFNYDTNFLFAFRCDKIKRKVRNLGFQSAQIDLLIEYYTSKSAAIKINRWWPIPLIGLILFPLWSEYVGNGISSTPFSVLLILAIILIFLTLYINFTLKTFLLLKANRYDELVNILKTIKTL